MSLQYPKMSFQTLEHHILDGQRIQKNILYTVHLCKKAFWPYTDFITTALVHWKAFSYIKKDNLVLFIRQGYISCFHPLCIHA